MSSKHTDIDKLLLECSSSGMRRTAALDACLRVLASADQPMTLQQIAGDSSFDVSCDPATIYRLVSRLEERRIVRRIGFHSRAAHYCLRESSHQDYLICRDCGSVEVLDIACPVEHLEKQIAQTSGFSDLEHELEFFGRWSSADVLLIAIAIVVAKSSGIAGARMEYGLWFFAASIVLTGFGVHRLKRAALAVRG